jgi:hypothetical protein
MDSYIKQGFRDYLHYSFSCSKQLLKIGGGCL